MRVEPAKHFVNWQQDPQANYLARLVFPERTREFRVEVDLVAEMAVLNPFDFFLEPYAEAIPFQYEATEALGAGAVSAARCRLTPLFAEYLARVPRTRTRTIDFLVALNQRLARDIRYLIRMEPGVQTPEQTLERAAGSCRDSELAAGAAAASSGPRGALRLRLSDPAQRATSSRWTDHREPSTTSPTCTPGAKSICPGPAGSGWIRPRGCWPARDTSRSPAPPSRHRRRRSAVRSMSPRCSSSTACRWRASGKRRASPSPTPRRSGRRSSGSAARSTPSSRRWMCA